MRLLRCCVEILIYNIISNCKCGVTAEVGKSICIFSNKNIKALFLKISRNKYFFLFKRWNLLNKIHR